MALDKLVDSTQLDTALTGVAAAIRAKGGTSAQLAFPAGFVSAIEAIPSGAAVETGSFTLAEATRNIEIVLSARPSHFLLYCADADVDTASTWKVTRYLLPKWGDDAVCVMRYGTGNWNLGHMSAGDNMYAYADGSFTATVSAGATYKLIAGVTYTWFAW